MRFQKFAQSNLRECLLYSFPKQSDLAITEELNVENPRVEWVKSMGKRDRELLRGDEINT